MRIVQISDCGMRILAAIVLAILLLGMMASSGCSGLQARGVMAQEIDVQAAKASVILPRATAGDLTEQEARDLVTFNAATFRGYANYKTTNILAYWFGGKLIYVNGEYAGLLDRTALLAEETESRASTQPASWLNAVVAKESEVLIKVKDAKDGKKGDKP